MIIPIVSYGNNILRQKCREITIDHPGLNELIENMWETLYKADGCGLAAPQVNQSLRLFIVDSVEVYDRLEDEERTEFFEGDHGIKETFINALIRERSKDTWIEKEGCLSIPTLSEEVERSWSITIEYYDRNFQKQKKTFYGVTARMIQHEYDHTDGKLYIDYLKPLTKRMLNGKLVKISKGQVTAKYAMRFSK
jgi:peptide deformylase